MREKKGNKKTAFAIGFLIVFFVCLYIILNYFGINENNNTNKKMTEVLNIINSIDASDNSDIYAYSKDGFFYVTKDGLEFLSFDGKQIYSDSYNFIKPITTGEEEIFCVSEHKSKSIHVYSTERKLYSKEFEFPVLSFAINKEGFSVVILDASDEYRIIVSDDSGNEVAFGSIQEKNVVPVSVDISNDGKRFFVSYLDFNREDVNSIVSYYFTTDSDALNYNLSNADGEYASNAKNIGEYIFNIQVIDDKNLLIISDKSIILADYINPSDYKWKIELTNEISSISINENKGFAVALGRGFVNTKSDPVGTVKYYDFNMNLLWVKEHNEEIDYLNFSSDKLIIGHDNKYEAYNPKGDSLWQYIPVNEIKEIFFAGDKSSIIELNQTGVSLCRLMDEATPKENIDVENIDDRHEPEEDANTELEEDANTELNEGTENPDDIIEPETDLNTEGIEEGLEEETGNNDDSSEPDADADIDVGSEENNTDDTDTDINTEE